VSPATSLYARWGKRGLDLVLTSMAITVLWPVALVVAWLVRRHLGSPVLFKQARPGKDGVLFTILKFRTMTDLRGPDGEWLSDADRLPPLGLELRRTSLDELPELINVLRGDMSLVCPRPLFAKYLPLYSEEQALRHSVRPGLTGWAQVNGRNAITWNQKFEFDVWYVRHLSLLLDLRIIGLTLLKIVARDGINEPGHATAQEFTGNA